MYSYILLQDQAQEMCDCISPRMSEPSQQQFLELFLSTKVVKA